MTDLPFDSYKYIWKASGKSKVRGRWKNFQNFDWWSKILTCSQKIHYCKTIRSKLETFTVYQNSIV